MSRFGNRFDPGNPWVAFTGAVMAKLSKLTLVLALMFSIGVHWSLLQSAAWIGMVVTYSSEGSFTEAVSKTFDGSHPCQLCKLVEHGQGSADGVDLKKSDSKADVCVVSENTHGFPQPPAGFFVPSADFLSAFVPLPPVPPPRVA